MDEGKNNSPKSDNKNPKQKTMIIKIQCKVCGAEKSKWAMCKNTEAHDKIFNKKMEEKFGQLHRNVFEENWFNGTHNDAAILNKK